MSGEAPRRLRRAEAVLARRTGRFLLVLERCTDPHNHMAVVRTAEAFGVAALWVIEHEDDPGKRMAKAVTKGSHHWVDVRRFSSTEACVEALHAGGWTIWATDLWAGAEELRSAAQLQPMPERVALVLGRESDGISPAMREAAARRLYLPMEGYTESFNLSVAAALFLQRLFDACPEARGDLPEAERQALRQRWYQTLGGKTGSPEWAPWLDAPPEALDSPRPAPESRRPRIKKQLARRLGIEFDRHLDATQADAQDD